MKPEIHIVFDFRRCMLWDPKGREAVRNNHAPVTLPTRLLMDTLCDLYDFAAERGYPTIHEKQVFEKLYEISLPIIRNELEASFSITNVEYPYVFKVDARDE